MRGWVSCEALPVYATPVFQPPLAWLIVPVRRHTLGRILVLKICRYIPVSSSIPAVIREGGKRPFLSMARILYNRTDIQRLHDVHSLPQDSHRLPGGRKG